MKKWVTGFGLSLALFLGLLYCQIYLKSVDDGISGPAFDVPFAQCENSVVTTIASPDGRLKAVVFVRDYGGFGPMSTHVSVLNASDILPNEPGNTFIAAPIWVSLGPKGDIPLTVTWTEDRQLQIGYLSQKDMHHRIEIHERSRRVGVVLSRLHRERVNVIYEEAGP